MKVLLLKEKPERTTEGPTASTNTQRSDSEAVRSILSASTFICDAGTTNDSNKVVSPTTSPSSSSSLTTTTPTTPKNNTPPSTGTYIETLSAHEVEYFPVLEVSDVADEELDAKILENLQNCKYSVVVVTSARASAALRRIMKRCTTASAPVSGGQFCCCFAVGAQTARALLQEEHDDSDVENEEEQGKMSQFFSIRGTEAGNAAALLPLIIDAVTTPDDGRTNDSTFSSSSSTSSTSSSSTTTPLLWKPVLFLRGDKALDTIPSGLAAKQIPCEQIIVYHTRQIPAEQLNKQWRSFTRTGFFRTTPPHITTPSDNLLIGSSFSDAHQTGAGDTGHTREGIGCDYALVFFSPSGVDAVASCPDIVNSLMDLQMMEEEKEKTKDEDEVEEGRPVGNNKGLSQHKAHLIAIGPTTAKAIASRGWTVHATAATPDARGVMEALGECSAK